MREALTALGYPVCDDYHAPGALGLSRVALTVRDGHRVSTNDAYLEPARERPNLVVRGDVLVDRVALDGRRAVGVVTADGEHLGAGEVIVSAGAIHSPAILLRSGIGPEGPSGGLPVGANLVDHAAIPGFELKLRPEGRLDSVDVSVLTSVLRYSSGLADAGDADMQVLWFSAVGPRDEDRAGARILAAAMRCFSRGQVRLRTDDPRDDPAVEFRMLSDERDLVRLRDATRRVLAIVRQPADRGGRGGGAGRHRTTRTRSPPTTPSTPGWRARSTTTCTPPAPAAWALQATRPPSSTPTAASSATTASGSVTRP